MRVTHQAVLALLLTGGTFAASTTTPADRVARDQLHLHRYRAAEADLNGDGRAELFIYAEGADHCGSGGCDLYVLTPRAGEYAVMADVPVSRLPVRLLPSTTRGWRDLSVFVEGGGIIPGYTARLRFDGRRYPGNPTVSPAEPMRRATGRVLIGAER